MQPPRRESAQNAAFSTSQRPGALKHRAYSAPLVPKNCIPGEDDQHLADALGGDPADDDEIAGDPFFQRFNFPQPHIPLKEEASSSSVDSSSDTEGPLSPTHVKGRHPQAVDNSLPSPRSPAPSVAVRSSITFFSPHFSRQ